MTNREHEREKWDRFYSQNHVPEEEDTLKQFNLEFSAAVRKLLPAGGKTLEAGCGAGWQSVALARTHQFDVTLLDFSDQALNRSKELFDKEALTARFLREDAFTHGQPEYDLVFNAGVLEHYTYPEQVHLLKAMASRAKRFVLVLAPNANCYWYWLWRIQATSLEEWDFGKEVPILDFSELFRDAGLSFIGHQFLGSSWTEDFINNIRGIDLTMQYRILQVHRSGILSPAHTGYLIAGLGAVPGADVAVPVDWSNKQPPSFQVISELSASLADLSANYVHSTTRIAQLLEQVYEKESVIVQRDQRIASDDQIIRQNQKKIIELQQAVTAVTQTMQQVQSTRTWRAVVYLGKIRQRVAPPGSFRSRAAGKILRLLFRRVNRHIEPSAVTQEQGGVPDYIEEFLTRENDRRVLLVTRIFFDPLGNNMQFGGAERYLLELAGVISSLGYDPLIVQLGKDYWMRYYHQVRVIGIRVGEMYDQFIPNLEALNPKGTLAIYSPFELASDKIFLPSIGISHGVYWDDEAYQNSPEKVQSTSSYFKAKIDKLKAFVSVDTNTLNWLRTVSLETSKKGVCIPNFVDLAQFSTAPEADKRPARLIVLFPRRLVHQRGFWLVHNIIPALIEEYPELDFYFIGKAAPQEQQAVTELVQRFPERVRWFALPPEEMPSAYKQAHITLIPTIQSEGTSLSCLEAMAAGNAVIATNVGGLTDLILDGYNGLLIEPDSKALMAAVRKLIENPQLREQLAQHGREVARNFSLEVWKSRWSEVLRKELPTRSDAGAQPPHRFVVFPFGYGIQWHGVQQRPHHLAVQFVKQGYEVYWYSPEGRLPDPLPKLHILERSDELYVKRPVLFIYYPHSYLDIGRFINPIVVYDVLDDISIHDTSGDQDSARQARECHEKLLERADVVIASSRLLVEQIKPRRPDIIYVPNAVDIEHFSPRQPQTPPDGKSQPVIGYHGAVATWFDGQLVADVARLRPQYQFVIIGPVSDAEIERLLKAQPNIQLVGAIPYEDLPDHVAKFDVGIMPFKLSPLTHAVRPLKILEYLALKKPVVATPMREILDWPGVKFAESAQAFAEHIDRAVREGFSDDGSIQSFVNQSTWAQVIQPLLTCLKE